MRIETKKDGWFRKKEVKNFFVLLHYVGYDGKQKEFEWHSCDDYNTAKLAHDEIVRQVKNQKESIVDRVFEETVLGEKS